jgi:hypothetical protein
MASELSDHAWTIKELISMMTEEWLGFNRSEASLVYRKRDIDNVELAMIRQSAPVGSREMPDSC